MESKSSNYLKVGVFVLLGLVVAAALIFIIGNERHIVDVTLRLVYVQNAAQFRLRVLELAAPVERNAKLLLRLRKQRRGPIVREEQRFRQEAGMPKERAMQLLDALQQNEKAEQKKLLLEKRAAKKGGKDW